MTLALGNPKKDTFPVSERNTVRIDGVVHLSASLSANR